MFSLRAVGLWLLLLCSTLLGGCGGPPTIQQSLKTAREAYDAGDYTRARAAWTLVLERRRDHPGALYGIGLCHLHSAADAQRQGNVSLALHFLDQADHHLQAALEVDPGMLAAAQALATSQRRRGDYGRASEVVQFPPQTLFPGARQHLLDGAEHERLGDLEAAVQAYRTAMAIAPEDPAAYHALARIHQKTGDDERATELLAEADQRQRVADEQSAARAQRSRR